MQTKIHKFSNLIVLYDPGFYFEHIFTDSSDEDDNVYTEIAEQRPPVPSNVLHIKLHLIGIHKFLKCTENIVLYES